MPLAQRKNGDEQFWKEIFHAATGKVQYELINGPLLFFEGVRGGEEFFGFIPLVPNSTWISSHMICPKFNSHVYKLKKWSLVEHICFHFATGGPKEC
jgi:hypothetical protein